MSNENNIKQDKETCCSPLSEPEKKLKKHNAIFRWILYIILCILFAQYFWGDNMNWFGFLISCFGCMLVLCFIDDFIFKLQIILWNKNDQK